MGLILAEKTRLTSDAFIILQNLAVIEFSMTMHPVADAQAATALLTSYIQGFSSKAVNPLKLMPQASMSTDQSIMKGDLEYCLAQNHIRTLHLIHKTTRSSC